MIGFKKIFCILYSTNLKKSAIPHENSTIRKKKFSDRVQRLASINLIFIFKNCISESWSDLFYRVAQWLRIRFPFKMLDFECHWSRKVFCLVFCHPMAEFLSNLTYGWILYSGKPYIKPLHLLILKSSNWQTFTSLFQQIFKIQTKKIKKYQI